MKKLKKLSLIQKKNHEFCYRGLLVHVILDKKRSMIQLKTRVFSEKNYIPLSVRQCVKKIFKKAKIKKFPAYLKIEEESCSIDLIQVLPDIVHLSLYQLAKLFVFAARSWAPVLKYLADQDLMRI